MKTIFITMADPMTVRNIFRTPFWPAFLAVNKDVRIVVLTLPDKKDYYEKTFGGPNVVFEGVDPRWKGRFANTLGTLARSALHTHTNLWSKMRSYLRGDSSWIATWIKRGLTVTFGRTVWYKRLLRLLILKIKPDPALAKLFDAYKPAAVIATYTVSFDFDIPVNTEARRRGIKIIGLTRSWDSLSSHGMLRVVPDVLLVQNRLIKEHALQYQGFPKKLPIHVVGLPHYDAYKRKESFIESREAFFSRMGLDPSKKFVLYGAMGDFLFPHEGGLAQVFERITEQGMIQAPVQFVYRAHPKFKSPLEKMQNMKHVRPDRGVTYKSESLASFEMEDADERHLMNSIYHADVIVTAGSTFAIDAAVFDKPTICVGFDGTATHVPYWESVKRFYDRYTHFEALVETGGVRIASTPEELANDVQRYLEHPSLEHEGRCKIIDLLVEPFDGEASQRLNKMLTTEIRKL